MSDEFNFIAIKDLEKDLLFNVLIDEITSEKKIIDNMYISILPPVEDLYLIEFADFIPITRFRDMNILKYLKPLSRTFNAVYFLFNDIQMNRGRYQKYINGNLEEDFRGNDAIEKGLKYDLFIDETIIANHFKQYWNQLYKKGNLRLPEVYQLVKDTKVLNTPVLLDTEKFYG